MQYAVCSVALPELTPEAAVATLAELGYAGIEWRIIDQQPAPDGQPGFWAGNRCTWPFSSLIEDAPRIAALTRAAGLAMPALATYVGCHEPAAVERAMQGAVRLGVRQVRVTLPRYDGRESYRAMRARALAQFGEVAALARQYGVRALVELHHGALLPSASAAAAFLERFDPRDVGAIHDAGNLVHEGYEHPRLGLEALGPYLAHVHLKNARWRMGGARADGSRVWQAEWAPLDQGCVDVALLLRCLRLVGYDGWISLEDFSTEQPLHERLRANLAFVQRVAAMLSEADAAAIDQG